MMCCLCVPSHLPPPLSVVALTSGFLNVLISSASPSSLSLSPFLSPFLPSRNVSLSPFRYPLETLLRVDAVDAPLTQPLPLALPLLLPLPLPLALPLTLSLWTPIQVMKTGLRR
jgi:hypothetical protein